MGLTVVAYFSEKEGEEGKFLGAELVIERFKSNSDGTFSSMENPTTTSVSLGYNQAVRALGASSVVGAAQSAAHR